MWRSCSATMLKGQRGGSLDAPTTSTDNGSSRLQEKDWFHSDATLDAAAVVTATTNNRGSSSRHKSNGGQTILHNLCRRRLTMPITSYRLFSTSPEQDRIRLWGRGFVNDSLDRTHCAAPLGPTSQSTSWANASFGRCALRITSSMPMKKK